MNDPYHIAVSTSIEYNPKFAGSPLAVDCPNCGNPAGTTCTGANGRTMGTKMFHQDRQRREQELASRRRASRTLEAS